MGSSPCRPSTSIPASRRAEVIVGPVPRFRWQVDHTVRPPVRLRIHISLLNRGLTVWSTCPRIPVQPSPIQEGWSDHSGALNAATTAVLLSGAIQGTPVVATIATVCAVSTPGDGTNRSIHPDGNREKMCNEASATTQCLSCRRVGSSAANGTHLTSDRQRSTTTLPAGHVLGLRYGSMRISGASARGLHRSVVADLGPGSRRRRLRCRYPDSRTSRASRTSRYRASRYRASRPSGWHRTSWRRRGSRWDGASRWYRARGAECRAS